ncbi:MAG: zinc ribbon domain-containing protein [Thaumarchaeota archaeon]|nr:zinc ribbon domain-containing protein [Candidatus Calditenuaceae archaeon]MDW8186599.1 zinc ribbon domain-containing protein [Nitrososphaerota archaeon]
MASMARITGSVVAVAVALSLPTILSALPQIGEVTLPFYGVVTLAVIVIVPAILVRSFLGATGSAMLGVVIALLYVLSTANVASYVQLWDPFSGYLAFAVPEPLLRVLLLVTIACALSGTLGHLFQPRRVAPLMGLEVTEEAPSPAIQPATQVEEQKPGQEERLEEVKAAPVEEKPEVELEVSEEVLKEETVKCVNCGSEIPLGAKFCPYCGKES